MIDLDTNNSVSEVSMVQAIRPMLICSTMAFNDPNRPDPTVNPDACQVYVGGHWLIVNQGVSAIRELLHKQTEKQLGR